MEYKFHTSLNKGECIKRLTNAIRPPRFFDSEIAIKYGMVGKVDGSNFFFEPIKTGSGRGGTIIAPKGFTGKIEETTEGTIITGKLTNNGGRLMIVAALLLLLFIIPQVIKSGPWPSILFFVLAIAVIIFLYSIRDKGEKSINFIKDTLEAQQVIAPIKLPAKSL